MRAAVDAGMDQAYERTMRPYMANIETAMMTLSADTSFYEAVFTEQESERSLSSSAKEGIELAKEAARRTEGAGRHEHDARVSRHGPEAVDRRTRVGGDECHLVTA